MEQSRGDINQPQAAPSHNVPTQRSAKDEEDSSSTSSKTLDVSPEHSSSVGAPIGVAESGLAFEIDRNSDTYNQILSQAKWWRDSLLIGPISADTRIKEGRNIANQVVNVQVKGDETTLPIEGNQSQCDYPRSEPHALGLPMLLSSSESYLRSVHAVDLLRPYATWIASKDGPLKESAVQSAATTVYLSQELIDWAAKDNLLWILKDEEWREFAKDTTTSYVGGRS
ncbi:hypothetical protein THAOC_00691 [Thalassiosira oceanica]|uniref:Uncharacterized protein n=1 Tax=Thalassiosira oceanica TaxID=159749 RepID=K0TJU7_THAOC|nr:hypothetical protein THAOC_00691 [Thalassiosira oceanica]|eukprot:EJK77479.1 hypothetical protein THAOC_00691 [Thalassiosira oceanica]